MRNLNEEHQDLADACYSYDFDDRMHGYMLRTFDRLNGTRALELGCYRGSFTSKLRLLFDHLTVVEGAADLIAAARERVGDGVEFVHARFEDFQPETAFDAIFLIHTLEHLDEPCKILRRIGSWLTPGGKLYVAVPNAHAASRQIAVQMGLMTHTTDVTETEYLHGHRRTYDNQALRNHLESAGFKITRAGGIFFKAFANSQFDSLIAAGIIENGYLEGCYHLGEAYPDLCASIFAICELATSTG